MGATTQTVTVYLSIRDDDAPLTDLEVVDAVRKIVFRAVERWYDNDRGVRETLRDFPDIEPSIAKA